MKYTDEYLEKLDKVIEMIPLTIDAAFKSVMFKNTKLFKRFLIETLDINIKPEESNLVFLDKELIKENYKEKGKIVDLNVKLGNHLLITVEVNRRDFEEIKERNKLYLEKIHTMQFETGEEYKELKSRYLYQLNLNSNDRYKKKGENIIVSYDITDNKIYDDNEKIYIKHLEFYKDMFYTNYEKMKFDEIFMAGMMSKNFKEIYYIMKTILSNKELNKFMGSMINMSKEWIPIHEWEKEKMEKLVRDKAREIATKEGIEKGREEKTIAIIKNMLNNNIEYEMISKITGKSIKEIKEIEKMVQ